MNPLTLVKRIQNINAKEASLGIYPMKHLGMLKYRYVFAGGIPFDLTEGDLLAIFAQYGEIVDVRNKDTGKSKGFAFIAYEDQRSTILAVDNLKKKREVCYAIFLKGECNRGGGCKYSHDEQRAANTGLGHHKGR